MSQDDDHIGKTLSFAACEQAGTLIRNRLNLDETEPVPTISRVLFQLDLDIVIRPEEEMAGQQAFAIPAEREIHFRSDVFQNVMDNSFVTEDDSTETQADRIARAAMMPEAMVKLCGNARSLAEMALVPLPEAVTRMKDLLLRSARTLQPASRLEIASFKVTAATDDKQRQRALAEQTKFELWSQLSPVENEDPATSRVCQGYRISWKEYGCTTECGWFIDQGAAKSWFAFKHH